MFFLAQPITAHDALNVGLINRIAAPEELEKVLEEQFLTPLRRNSVMSISAIKRQFRALSKAANVMPSETFERINAYRTKVYQGADYLEGIRSFLEKRTPEYREKPLIWTTSPPLFRVIQLCGARSSVRDISCGLRGCRPVAGPCRFRGWIPHREDRRGR